MKNVLIKIRTSLKFFILVSIATFLIIGAVILLYKPIYSVTLNGELVGYCAQKSKLQARIDDFIENGNGDNGNVAFVELDDMPKYNLCLLKRGITTNDEEIYQKIAKTGTTYYKYYAILDDNEEKLSVSDFSTAEEVVKGLKEKNSENCDDIQIIEKYDIPHISTGDIFRANIKEGTELGKKAQEYMNKGELVPDELVVDLVVDRVNQEDCKNGYVLDGFPRTIPQAEALDRALAEMGQKIDYAIDVEVPDENIVNRMSGRRACVDCGATYHIVYAPTAKEGICDKCGGELILRDDDKPETVLKRLGVYHEQTQPLIDYYTKEGILKSVDGTKDLEEVFADIVAILGE